MQKKRDTFVDTQRGFGGGKQKERVSNDDIEAIKAAMATLDALDAEDAQEEVQEQEPIKERASSCGCW